MVRPTALMTFAWTGLIMCCHRSRIKAMAQSDDDDSSSSEDDIYPDCDGDTALVGDAICDFVNNSADCGFDGGDCCECTCVSSDDHNCGEGGSGFFCLDPGADQNCGETASPTMSPTATPTTSALANCDAYLPYVGDGYCDKTINVPGCGFDGGDCCACTCVDGPNHSCGELGGGFDCLDPDVPPGCDATPSPTAAPTLAGCTGNLYYFQDGICDEFLNSVDCSFDGGDCCACTCREYSPYYDSASPSWYDYCGVYGYDCKDPAAPTDCPEAMATDSPTPSPTVNADYPFCTGTVRFMSDGDCDASNNNAECDFDGGDCCSCTCTRTACGPYYDCVDPEAECVDNDDYSISRYSTLTSSSNVRDSPEDCASSSGGCAPTVSPAMSGARDDDGVIDDAGVASSATDSGKVAAGSVIGWTFVSVAGYCLFGGLIIASLAYLSKRCGVGESSAAAASTT